MLIGIFTEKRVVLQGIHGSHCRYVGQRSVITTHKMTTHKESQDYMTCRSSLPGPVIIRTRSLFYSLLVILFLTSLLIDVYLLCVILEPC